nr:hypothetical protein [Candidatus Solincola tengchongensis]
MSLRAASRSVKILTTRVLHRISWFSLSKQLVVLTLRIWLCEEMGAESMSS